MYTAQASINQILAQLVHVFVFCWGIPLFAMVAMLVPSKDGLGLRWLAKNTTCFAMFRSSPNRTDGEQPLWHIKLRSSLWNSSGYRLIWWYRLWWWWFSPKWTENDCDNDDNDYMIMICYDWLVVWNMNFMTFEYIGNGNRNWLSYFSEGGVYHQPVRLIWWYRLWWWKSKRLFHDTGYNLHIGGFPEMVVPLIHPFW